MKLYKCWNKYDGDCLCYIFVFAVNANQAKRMTVNWEHEIGNWETTYQEIKCCLIGNTDKVTEPIIVESRVQSFYPVVLELGGSFRDYSEEVKE